MEAMMHHRDHRPVIASVDALPITDSCYLKFVEPSGSEFCLMAPMHMHAFLVTFAEAFNATGDPAKNAVHGRPIDNWIPQTAGDRAASGAGDDVAVDDGWVMYDGRNHPGASAYVELRFVGVRANVRGRAENFRWKVLGKPSDIVAYRIIPDEVAAVEGGA